MTTIGLLDGASRVGAATTEERIDGAAAPTGTALLPEPDAALAFSGDPAAELAALAVETGTAQRKEAQVCRDLQRQDEQREDQAQVAALRAKASDILDAGLVEGVGMMGEGALDFAAAPEVTSSGTPTPDGAKLRAAGTFTRGISTIGAGTYKAAEASCDADAAAHKAAADRARQAADDMHDARKDAEQYVSAAIDFYRDYTSAQASERAALLHRS